MTLENSTHNINNNNNTKKKKKKKKKKKYIAYIDDRSTLDIQNIHYSGLVLFWTIMLSKYYFL